MPKAAKQPNLVIKVTDFGVDHDGVESTRMSSHFLTHKKFVRPSEVDPGPCSSSVRLCDLLDG